MTTDSSYRGRRKRRKCKKIVITIILIQSFFSLHKTVLTDKIESVKP